jgi:hypothetical protein
MRSSRRLARDNSAGPWTEADPIIERCRELSVSVSSLAPAHAARRVARNLPTSALSTCDCRASSDAELDTRVAAAPVLPAAAVTPAKAPSASAISCCTSRISGIEKALQRSAESLVRLRAALGHIVADRRSGSFRVRSPQSPVPFSKSVTASFALTKASASPRRCSVSYAAWPAREGEASQ